MSELSDALNKQGLLFLSVHNHPRAIEFFQEAINVEPTMADAYSNLGVALFMHHRFEDAATVLLQSLALRPDHPETLLNLGYAFWRLSDLHGAKDAFQRAVEVDDMALAHIGLGSIYWDLGDGEMAIHHCQEGLRRAPESVLGHDTLREVYHFRGCEADALAACDAMIEMLPKYPVDKLAHKMAAALYKRAMVMLTYDDPAGWAAHECRYDCLDGLATITAQDAKWFSILFARRWDGKPTGHLVVATEQGYGDVIQFLRYLPLVAARCEKLTLHIPHSLRKLAKQSFNLPNMDIADEFPEVFDHYCLIMSLPYLLDAIDDIPACPYLSASPHKYDEIRELPRVKIGLAWAGSKSLTEDRWRSISFEKMSRLLDLPAQFVSLQFPAENLSKYPIIDPQPVQTSFNGKMAIDWTETAGLIDTLDLVISVDTAVVHLAGAMGKPVWMLNRVNTDWRWGLNRSDSPWYPTLRIFRQSKLGDWDTVIETVREGLVQFLACRV